MEKNTYILPDSSEEEADATVDETFVLVDTKTAQELENKTIDASKNNIVNIDASSLAASAKIKTISPLFPNITFEANASNNQVSVFMGNETVDAKILQYYKISTDTTDGTLHAGKFLITVNLDEFESFDSESGKIKFLLKTTSEDTDKNKLNIKISDLEGSELLEKTNIVTLGNAWEIIEIDLSEVDISQTSLPADKAIQIEINFDVSTGQEIFISNITSEYKGK